MNERDETEIGRRCHSRSATLAISAGLKSTGKKTSIIISSRHSKKALPPERIELSIS